MYLKTVFSHKEKKSKMTEEKEALILKCNYLQKFNEFTDPETCFLNCSKGKYKYYFAAYLDFCEK